MSETELHRGLTRSLTKVLQDMFPDMMLSADLHDMPGQASTPNIGGFKPDVFGRCLKTNRCLVGEAKTTGLALQDRHSERQMKSFLSLLEAEGGPMFFLASPENSRIWHAGRLAFFNRNQIQRTLECSSLTALISGN